MNSDVSVSGRVLDRPIVGLLRVGLVFDVTAGLVELGRESKVDDVNVVLVALAETEQQILRLNVIVNVTLSIVDYLKLYFQLRTDEVLK